MEMIPANWDKFQHYKDRCPPWIKLHKGLLDDRAFMTLPLASKALAPLMWLLASESKHGVFNADVAEIAFRLRLTEAEVNEGLKPLIEKGFFLDASTMLAPCLQDAIPETEGETEAKTEGETESSTTDVVLVDEGSPTDKPQNVPYKKIVELYHEHFPAGPRVKDITDPRRKAINARWKSSKKYQDLLWWEKYFRFAATLPGLTGGFSSGWIANLDSLLSPTKFQKIVEGGQCYQTKEF